jgi:3',5'-nucleoside bisphosphate phosphatase
MPDYVDLHAHTTASDGTLAPAALVRLAQRVGLTGLAITDHDTTSGIAEAAAEAQRLSITLLPAIEISCSFPAPGTLHLLGYGIDPASQSLHDSLANLVSARTARNTQIISCLNDLGLAITESDVLASAPAGAAAVIGRPHIAQALIRKGYVNNITEAFRTYLGRGARAFVDKEHLSPAQALQIIRKAGGLPVLAHPMQLRCESDSQLETAIKSLVDQGLAGIEVLHSDHNAATIEKLTALAHRWKLLTTGGSDFHGTNKTNVRLGYAGRARIPRQFLDDLLNALATARPSS